MAKLWRELHGKAWKRKRADHFFSNRCTIGLGAQFLNAMFSQILFYFPLKEGGLSARRLAKSKPRGGAVA
jgi:hypothetical protein